MVSVKQEIVSKTQIVLVAKYVRATSVQPVLQTPNVDLEEFVSPVFVRMGTVARILIVLAEKSARASSAQPVL